MAAEHRQRNKQWIEDYKAKHPCVRCGETHTACLEFHHRDPDDKRENVMKLVHGGASIDHIKREVSKCDVLCANCHRKLHWELERAA